MSEQERQKFMVDVELILVKAYLKYPSWAEIAGALYDAGYRLVDPSKLTLISDEELETVLTAKFSAKPHIASEDLPGFMSAVIAVVKEAQLSHILKALE